jgi:hypothetical protein
LLWARQESEIVKKEDEIKALTDTFRRFNPGLASSAEEAPITRRLLPVMVFKLACAVKLNESREGIGTPYNTRQWAN